MQTKDDLIRENTILRARLELAERWMQREVQRAMQEIQKQSVKSQARKHFANLLEEEGTDIIARRIHETFGDSLQSAPEFTLERLIDAEIYWQTLQKYPTMDGLPVIMAYQKILDAWVEEKLIRDFRKSFSPENGELNGVIQRGIPYGVTHPNPPLSRREFESLARDIENIITKKYTLSLWRFYQILKLVRDSGVSVIASEAIAQSRSLAPIVTELVVFWQENIPEILKTLLSDDFFVPLSELMNREIFTKKRHETKVTFSDVKKTREILIEKRILLFLFTW